MLDRHSPRMRRMILVIARLPPMGEGLEVCAPFGRIAYDSRVRPIASHIVTHVGSRFGTVALSAVIVTCLRSGRNGATLSPTVQTPVIHCYCHVHPIS